jgi:acyl dehydratase
MAAPAVVQYQTYQTQGTNGENDSVVQFKSPTKAGDTIYVAVTISDYAGVHSLTVTDTQGNVYTELNQENDGPPGSQTVAQFYASNIKGDSGTPDTITMSTGFEDYRGLLVAEITGVGSAPLVGNSGHIQDGLSAGSGNVTSGGISVAASQAPALLVAVSMNTSGGSSDTGGSGYGAPAAGPGLTSVTTMWDWGLNLGNFEIETVSAGTADATFDAPDTDSFATVAAVFAGTGTTAAAPTVKISASATSVVSGSSSTLTWSSTNATSCTASGAWSGSESVSGSTVVTPSATSTYTITCSNPSGTAASAAATVAVTLPLPTETLSASTNPITAGGSSVLTWSSKYATSCAASGAWSGSKGTSGSLAVSPAVSSLYTLTCTNATGSSSYGVTVDVNAAVQSSSPAPAVAFSASPTTIVVGGDPTLTWSSTNASFCTASGAWGGRLATSGKQVVSPTATSTYHLECTNSSASSPMKSVTITVNPPKPTVSLSASSASITTGGSSTLTWSSTNAASCTASGAWSGSKAASGSLSVSPTATATYTLTCTNVTGSAAHSVGITVVAPKTPELVQWNNHQTVTTAFEVNSSAQFTSLTKAGDTIWVVATVTDYGGVHEGITVTDTQGNVYKQLDQLNDESPGFQSVVQFYATDIHGDSSTPDTVTVNWSRDEYKGVVIAEIAGVTPASLVGHSAKLQDGLAVGTNNITAGAIAVSSAQVPALVVGLSMNTTGGVSNIGGSGYGGPAVGSGFTEVGQAWNWGLDLATIESVTVKSATQTATTFSAGSNDSYATVSAAFH